MRLSIRMPWLRKGDASLSLTPQNRPETTNAGVVQPYHFDQPWAHAFPQSPKRKPGGLVTTDTLRAIADSYDVLRSCINHLKREVWTVPIAFAPKDAEMDPARAKKLVAQAEEWFGEFGGLGGGQKRRSQFENEAIEDLQVIGASAIWLERTVGGGVLSAQTIDAATIRPVVDAYGWAADFPYEQWVYGAKVAQFAPDEIIYDGLWSKSNTPYFMSPVEWLIAVVTSALKADEWNREYLISGNTPADLISLPDHWTPTMIREYADFFDLMMTGNTQERRKTKFIPGGSSRLNSKMTTDREFADFELWLLRRTCAIMGVQPAAIGFVGDQYKESQAGSMDQTTRFGAGAIVEWRNALYNRILGEIGLGELRVIEKKEQVEETPAEKTERVATLVGKPILTINEGRAEMGLPPIPGGDTLATSEPDPFEDNPKDKKDAKNGKSESEKQDKDEGKGDDAERLFRAGLDIDAESWKPTKKRRKKAWSMFQATLSLFEKTAESLVEDLVAQSFADFDGSAERFGKEFAKLVLKSHVQAAKAGATLTGTPDKVAMEIGTENAEGKQEFIDGFIADIKSGKYKDPASEVEAILREAILRRAKFYTQALTGSANEAALVSVPGGTKLNWVLEPLAKHCDDCPSLSNMGPYTPETIPCVPGDGFTACGDSCQCELALEDGTRVSIHDRSDDGTEPNRADVLKLWERKAIKRLKSGKGALCSFEDSSLDAGTVKRIEDGLRGCTSAEDVKALFGAS